MKEIEISTVRIRWLAWACAAFAVPLLFVVGLKSEWQITLLLSLIFGLPIAFLYLCCALAKMDANRLSVHFPFGSYSMYWAEVNEFCEGGGNLKVMGTHKSITFPSFEFWHGNAKIEAIHFFEQSMTESGATKLQGHRALIPTLIGTKEI